MRNNDTLRNLLIAGGVFLLVLTMMQWFAPNPPSTPPQTTARPPIAEPSSTGALPTPPGDAAAMPTAGGWSVVEADAVETVAIGTETFTEPGKKPGRSNPYRARLTLSNVGASIESALMTDHAEHAGSIERYELLAPSESNGRQFRSMAVEKVNVDGVDVALDEKRWKLVHQGTYTDGGETGQMAEFSLDLLWNGAPGLHLSRTLKLPSQSIDTGRHDIRSDLTITNLTSAARQVVVTYRGGMGLRQQDPRAEDRFLDIGVRSGGQAVLGTRKSRSALLKNAAAPLAMFSSTANPKELLVWAAVANTYFTCTVAPLNRARTGDAEYIADVSAFDADGNPATDRDLSVRLVTRAESIAPQGALSYPADIYLGDKDGRAFDAVPEYRSRNYYFQVAQGYGFCTFSWLVTLMIWLLDSVYVLTRDYGVAIIILVVIVRTLLHPITKKGQVNMVRMQRQMADLAPKMEEIKKKYANDRVRMHQEIQKLGLNPAGQLLTCLPMFIQLPIWAALYMSLSHNIDMRHEPFLFTWMRDLTAPDALYPFQSSITIPVVGWVLTSFNLMPILVALTMYIQTKMQPKPPANPNMTDEQRMQQDMMLKMMPMMSIMMLFIFYNLPSGLNLYVMTSSILGSIEQWYIRKHIKERDAAGTLIKPVRPKQPAVAQAAAGASWLEKLQRMAEEAKKAQRAAQKAKPRR